MRMKRTFWLVLTTAVVVISALSLAAVPGLAGASAAKVTDKYLAADTKLNFMATIGGAGSTFAAPLENAAQAIFQARSPTRRSTATKPSARARARPTSSRSWSTGAVAMSR